MWEPPPKIDAKTEDLLSPTEDFAEMRIDFTAWFETIVAEPVDFMDTGRNDGEFFKWTEELSDEVHSESRGLIEWTDVRTEEETDIEMEFADILMSIKEEMESPMSSSHVFE